MFPGPTLSSNRFIFMSSSAFFSVTSIKFQPFFRNRHLSKEIIGKSMKKLKLFWKDRMMGNEAVMRCYALRCTVICIKTHILCMQSSSWCKFIHLTVLFYEASILVLLSSHNIPQEPNLLFGSFYNKIKANEISHST